MLFFSRCLRAIVTLLAVALLVNSPSAAHPLDEAVFELVAEDTDAVTVWLRLPRPQLAHLDQNHDGRLEEDELDATAIEEELRGKVEVFGNRGKGTLEVLPARPSAPSMTHTSLGLRWVFPERQDSFRVVFDYFVDSKDNPRCLASFEICKKKSAFVFDKNQTENELSTAGARFWSFVFIGAEHILTGYDHLLFLAVLLLAGGTLMDILKMVTAFTVAHSITLGLAVLEIFTLPGWFVEPVIVLSIAIAAVANLRSEGDHKGWMVAAGFGLIHGMGFAGLLADMNLSGWSALWPLVGFNVGVELGQALVVLVVAPGLLWMAKKSWAKRAMHLGSIVAGTIALVWFGQYVLETY